MKLFLGLALTAFLGLTSCKSDWDCVCDNPASQSLIIDAKKSDAETQCNESSPGSTCTVTKRD